ncbi:hypothetical protein [Azohydromonas lata]|uniref:hypothetical protein n=1 Tax=Azohydromonas lata TaxID=45677 RepID=UPI0012F4C435|nr:hypothetical protein [Azohydromonas lata]
MSKKILIGVVALSMFESACLAQGIFWKKGEFHIDGVVVESKRLDRKLGEAVKGGDVTILNGAVHSPELYVAYVSKPSHSLPLSRCGAGTEDVLMLIRYQNARLALLDKLEINSCEKGVLLTNQAMEVPVEPLSFIEMHDDWIEFWSTPPLTNPGVDAPMQHRYKIVKGRFVRRP